ncbi:helicase-associated domain-containing protein [bacterium]|nr:helicase-associated domain-containing protein [bacterium]
MTEMDMPLIVQSDRTMLLETDVPQYEAARDALAAFAEIVTSPEHFHTYRITPLSLWNAASAGLKADDVLASLRQFSRYPIPQNIEFDVREYMSRYGRLKLVQDGDALVLESIDPLLLEQILADDRLKPFFEKKLSKTRVQIKRDERGFLKQALIKREFPVEDLAGYVDGDRLDITLRENTLGGEEFALRHYQEDAVSVFYQNGRATGGSGVLVLPCGAGKTIIGLGIIGRISQHTLIVVTNITAVRQWRDELLDKTTLTPDQIGEYSVEVKEIRPVTITTYQILTYRKRREEDFIHMELFDRQSWGLIVYDEVHLLPAPVFRAVANIQSKRRLGLTATLLREDGKESDVFSLIGPKKIDIPWKTLEKQGWIAQALCVEVRIPLPEDERHEYAVADAKAKFRIASENDAKIDLMRQIIGRHRGDQILIIGQYLDQLEKVAGEFGAPIITGKTPNKEREEIYNDFRDGKIPVLIVSKVANFSIDLPDANVAIQISGTFGSRQEEAQRLGRILRPKSNGNMAFFYTLVTQDTREREFAVKRQLFLTEQGYRYRIVSSLDELNAPVADATAPTSSNF